ARAVLDPLPAYAPLEDKAPGWALEDAAAERLRAARVAEVDYVQAVRAALETAPDLPEARAHLTAWYRRRLLAAEAAGDADAAAEQIALLRSHDPEGSTEWLRGDGRVTLITDPPGAAVRLFCYTEVQRRLVPTPIGDLPPTPLVDHPLPMGSYALELAMPGRLTVTCPVLIERQGHWQGIAPGEQHPHAIWMPPCHAIGDGMAYV
ncbi:MAG: protein kinase, partial [Myxococcales bacterium]|nr:protein kinase [Myxococcales bacterium]